MCAKKKKTMATIQDYQKALAEAVKSPPHLIVIQGEQAFLSRHAVESIISSIRKKRPGIDEAVFHGPVVGEPPLSIGDILSEISSSSLFSSEKMVVARRADRIFFPIKSGNEPETKPSRRETPEDRFIDYLKSPDESTILILEFEKFNKQRRVAKKLLETALLIPCPALTRQGDVCSWLQSTASSMNKKLEYGVADMLFTAHGGHLGTLHSELEKLALYVGDATTIRVCDAEAFMSGTVEFDVFSMTNAVEERDLEKALTFARKMSGQGARDQSGKRMDTTGSAHMALSLLCKTMENILVARVIGDEGGDESTVASEAGTSPWRARMLMKAAGKYRLQELRDILGKLTEEMHSAHDTASDPSLSLERSVIACCRK